MSESFESGILEELQWRGFIKDITHDEVDELLDESSVTFYCGFDPSASSLHVGNAVSLMAMAHFYRHGHRPLALVGGATGMIGDPSGKDEERDLLDEEVIESNRQAIEAQLQGFMDQVQTRGGLVEGVEARAPKVVNNADWLKEWSFIDFLREVGRYFRVNAMIAKESVRARLEDREQGISYTEFSYMLIQAFDFKHLFEAEDCQLQLGGSDQWGNITAGTELIRRSLGEKAYGLSFPLLTSADGKKLGKSVDGAIFLDEEMTSPYDFYQYWVNADDRDCGALLRQFTFLERAEIEALEQRIEDGKNRGDVQRKLAYEVTALFHGEEVADKVVRASKMLFGEPIEGLSDEDLSSIFSDVPSTEFELSRLRAGELGVVDAFAEAGLQNSKGATRRLIKQGGAYLNNHRVEDREHVLSEEDLASETMMVLRSGKRKYHVLRFV